MTLIYLASPYTDNDPTQRKIKYDLACATTAKLIIAGNDVFSPIAHSHNIASVHIAGNAKIDWLKLDLKILKNCDLLAVLKLTGWETSTCVQAEIEEARRMRLPIIFLDDPSNQDD